MRKLIWSHINVYATDRVFAKILLMDVRSFSDYYTSETYKLVKKYTEILLEIIQEGVENQEIRNDIPPVFLRQAILGSIENICLTRVVFGRKISPDDLTEKLCKFVFKGIEQRAVK